MRCGDDNKNERITVKYEQFAAVETNGKCPRKAKGKGWQGKLNISNYFFIIKCVNNICACI